MSDNNSRGRQRMSEFTGNGLSQQIEKCKAGKVARRGK